MTSQLPRLTDMTVEAYETFMAEVRELNTRDRANANSNLARHLEIMNAIFGTDFTEGGKGKGK